MRLGLFSKDARSQPSIQNFRPKLLTFCSHGDCKYFTSIEQKIYIQLKKTFLFRNSLQNYKVDNPCKFGSVVCILVIDYLL